MCTAYVLSKSNVVDWKQDALREIHSRRTVADQRVKVYCRQRHDVVDSLGAHVFQSRGYIPREHLIEVFVSELSCSMNVLLKQNEANANQ